MGTGPNIYSIPGGAPFLPTLADALLSGSFGPLDRGNPLGLADVTILLPTRRAVRALSELFVERAGGATILPKIRPIGDVDEDEFLFEPLPEADALILPEAVGPLRRRLELAQLVLAWGRTVRRETLALGPNEPLLIPASPADAVRLASDLARLIDEMATAGISWDGLANLAPADHSDYWRLTLEFLQIAAGYWPSRLAELGLVDPASRRDALIRAEAARLAAKCPSEIFVAAGSTGSIPATAELLRVIASLPNGAVVLPGLDMDIDAASYEAIGDPDRMPVPGHPQYGLRQLLSHLRAERSDVVELGLPPERVTRRQRLVSEALRPAETTDAWASVAVPDLSVLDGVTLLVAGNEVEEALAIALRLRAAVDDGRSAALVTPDRSIARRVASELRRFRLEVDDSAGVSLGSTPVAIFARLIVEASVAPGDPTKLLAVLKHPLAGFGLARPVCRAGARILEREIFRGRLPEGGLEALPAAIAVRRRRLAAKERREGAIVTSDEDWALAARLALNVADALRPLIALAGGLPTAAEVTRALVDAIQAAGASVDEEDGAIWAGNAGEALAALLQELLGPAGELKLSLADYPGLLAAFLEGTKVTAPPTADPRIHLWGTLEARLQSVDLMILAGLDEGIWPATTRTDPWLSRPMRATLGLDPPERRIGLAAHDFAEAMGSEEIVLTRAAKRGGSPTVASRWVQRFLAVAGPEGERALTQAAAPWLALARRLDRVDPATVKPAPRPEPRPPVAERPRSLSVTEIETLVRDPYAIYAKHVLRLRPLEELGRPPDAALRGTLVHDALSKFTAEPHERYDADAEALLLHILSQAFAFLRAYPDVYALWSLRAEAVGRWFIGWEAARSGIAERSTEIAGEMMLEGAAGPFRLNGRTDRIDLRDDGAVEIYDFKTGTPPSPKQVVTGFAPQLALEAAMVHAGAFGEKFAGRPIAALAWLALGRAGRGEEVRSALGNNGAEKLAAMALGQLGRLIAAYDNPKRPYRSLERPMFERRWRGDYDHLARIGEWQVAGPEEDE